MSPRALRIAMTGALVAATAALASPAAAPAAVGGPWKLTGTDGVSLAATTVTPGTALVVQASVVGPRLQFAPQADVAPIGCDNATPGVTSCAIPAVSLSFAGSVVEAGVHGLTTGLVSFTGGSANDIFTLDGAGTVDSVVVDPGAGADAITVAGAVKGLTLAGADPTDLDPGDDRYSIQTTQLPPGTPALKLGSGNDVAASLSGNLEIDGGPGDDTLSGPGDLRGDAGADLVEPTVDNKVADGGADSDKLSFEIPSATIPAALTIHKAGTNVTVDGNLKTGFESVEGGPGNDTISGDGAPDVISGGDGNDTIAGGGGGDTLDGGPGDNTVSYATSTAPVNVDLTAGTASSGGVTDSITNFLGVQTGSGNDTVLGSAADEHFVLGAGDDSLNAGPGNDLLEGDDGNDLLRGGHGTDVIDGGPGRDTATYDERTASEPISVTLATPGDDGAPGENDTLVGIEDVIGGASSDVLVGDAGPNTLVGGGGLNTIDGGAGNDTLIGGDFRDVIVGGAGNDTLIGGGDDDSLSAFDGEADVVDCGPSSDDDAQVDAVDSVSGCEFSSRGDVPVPVDADHDGTVAGFDCNDNDPSIGLTAVDIPGDGIDQNCDGFDEPLALVDGGFELLPSRPTAHGQRIITLVMTALPGNSTVVVTCKTKVKRRCPFTRATRRPKPAGGDVSLSKLFKHRLLPVGTRIEVRITAPGTIGRVRRFTVRKSAAMGAADLCLLPGSSVAKRCPPDVL